MPPLAIFVPLLVMCVGLIIFFAVEPSPAPSKSPKVVEVAKWMFILGLFFVLRWFAMGAKG